MRPHLARRALAALAALSAFGADAAYAPATGEDQGAQIRFSAASGKGEQTYRLMQSGACPAAATASP